MVQPDPQAGTQGRVNAGWAHMMAGRGGARNPGPAQAPGDDAGGAGDDGPALARVQSTYDAIKAAILSNHLRPGHKLTHQSLAEMLGVSRTPVREALERLYQEGYVTRIQNRGFFVAQIDAAEARELYETREALEAFALQETMRRGVPKATLKELKAINRRYKELIQKNITAERLQEDRCFHLTLAGATGNRYLGNVLAAIFDRVILKRRVEGYSEQGLGPWREHCLILDAIEGGKSELAVQALRLHIHSACTRLGTHLEHSERSQAGIYRTTNRILVERSGI